MHRTALKCLKATSIKRVLVSMYASEGSSPSPPLSRLTPQLSRLPGRVLVSSQTEPPAQLQLGTLVWRVGPGPEPLAGHLCSHWQHGQLHQWWCGPGSSLQGARGEYVHQPTGNHPGHGAATEQGRGEQLLSVSLKSHFYCCSATPTDTRRYCEFSKLTNKFYCIYGKMEHTQPNFVASFPSSIWFHLFQYFVSYILNYI